MNLHACLCRYFTDYLPKIKGVSPETVKTYKEAFKLFLRFSSRHLSKATPDLSLEDMTPALIFSFLDYLEQQRKNSTRTRNARLIALKSFAKMLRLLYPEHRETWEMIFNIPQKRFGKRLIGYMGYDDILQVFGSVDLRKKEGFRDYTILHLLFDSGARASEVANLEIHFFELRTPVPMVLDVHGGPWARDDWGYNPTAQWLANRGYAVLNVNYRGSTGFGKGFTNAGNFQICIQSL